LIFGLEIWDLPGLRFASMGLFEDQSDGDVQRAESLVEQTIAALGVDPAQSRLGGGRGPRFALRRGSAAMIIAIHPATSDADAGTLRVVAPVVRLPDEATQGALFHYLLEANASELVGLAFGVVDGDVVLVSERSLRDLDASEVEAMVKTVGRAADRYDDVLADQFGTCRSTDTP
jgi:hypothetical protein